MKAATESEFLDRLDSDLAWRIKELSTVRSDVKTAAAGTRTLRLRAGIALLYAHWEGFVKCASEAYLEYVARRRLKHNELAPGFLSLALRAKLSQCSKGDDTTGFVGFAGFLLNEFDSRAIIPQRGVIGTGSNLNSKRLKLIMLQLGLDYGPYELKANLIDGQLLELRNNIAHGKSSCPEESDFDLLYIEVSRLLRDFKDQVSNTVLLRDYRRDGSQ